MLKYLEENEEKLVEEIFKNQVAFWLYHHLVILARKKLKDNDVDDLPDKLTLKINPEKFNSSGGVRAPQKKKGLKYLTERGFVKVIAMHENGEQLIELVGFTELLSRRSPDQSL